MTQLYQTNGEYTDFEKQVIEALYLLGGTVESGEFTYECSSVEVAQYVHALLGRHSSVDEKTVKVSETSQLSELLENFEEASIQAEEQGTNLVQQSEFEVENPCELEPIEQFIIITEKGSVSSTETNEYVTVETDNTRMTPNQSIPLFYSFVPMVVNSKDVYLCDTEEVHSAVQQKVMPGFITSLIEYTTLESDCVEEMNYCPDCDEMYTFSNTHQLYAHEYKPTLSTELQDIIKALVLSPSSQVLQSMDGWFIRLSGIPEEFGEWLQEKFSDSLETNLVQEDTADTYLFETYPSSSLNQFVEWMNGQRRVGLEHSNQILSVLFALDGEIIDRTVKFTLDNQENIYGEKLFERFQSMEKDKNTVQVKLNELDVFIKNNEIPGFESKWPSKLF